MNVLDAILQNGAAVRQVGAQVGLPEDRTAAGLAALVPALAAGFQRNAASSDGLQSLLAALSRGEHSKYLDDPAALSQPETIEDGNGILGHVFGSKAVSREVASQAAARTGIGADVLKRMLPVAAQLVMASLARQSSAPASLSPAGAGTAGAGVLGMLGAALDRDGDGSILDDVTNMLGGRPAE
jgi:hypothetical protein